MTSLWMFKKLFTWSFSSLMNAKTSHFHHFDLVTETSHFGYYSICQPHLEIKDILAFAHQYFGMSV